VYREEEAQQGKQRMCHFADRLGSHKDGKEREPGVPRVVVIVCKDVKGKWDLSGGWRPKQEAWKPVPQIVNAPCYLATRSTACSANKTPAVQRLSTPIILPRQVYKTCRVTSNPQPPGNRQLFNRKLRNCFGTRRLIAIIAPPLSTINNPVRLFLSPPSQPVRTGWRSDMHPVKCSRKETGNFATDKAGFPLYVCVCGDRGMLALREKKGSLR